MKIAIKDEIGIFKNSSFDLELEEGLTILTGCNGAGKSTLAKQIKKFLEGKDTTCCYLDCNEIFHLDPLYLPKGFRTETALYKSWSSEHEHYESMFYDWIEIVRPSDNFKGKDFVVIIDGLDSGADICFYQRHLDLFDLMYKDARDRGINFYIIVTCNNFYYLCKAKAGEVIFIPTLERFKLPKYKEDQFMEYVKEIKKTYKARGFDKK